LRFRWAGFLILALFFMILEIVVRYYPIHFLEQPEIFFINLKQKFVESGSGKEDIIVLGDSRSMALPGYSSFNAPYSVYNHSLPAMGANYYRSFLDKYWRSGNKPPKMVVFAGTSFLYSNGYGPPLYDQNGFGTLKNESLFEYIQRRWKEGLKRKIFGSPKVDIIQYSGKQRDRDQMLWEFFGHRYLHQFSFLELMDQYKGVERIFILAKSAPLLYHSYKFRGAIRNASSLENWSVSQNWRAKLEFCEACENIESGLCKPSISQREDNLVIEAKIQKDSGKYNISNRLRPEIIAFSKLRVAEEYKNRTEVELKKASFPAYDFSVLLDLKRWADEKGVLLGFLYMPWIDLAESWPETQDRKKKLIDFLQKNQIPFFEFPAAGYPSYQFVDEIHYDCRGEKRLAKEWEETVLPKIFSFLISMQKSN